ncbi:hypothetical protein [Rhodoglobus vestalii]|uniref:hypothetical protein n=1 Tax=Rhodoglobus vestalii TaxID=193384 RepID=UPI0014770407|nr:hypothetical protein [Rhodoglobus vestalii]
MDSKTSASSLALRPHPQGVSVDKTTLKDFFDWELIEKILGIVCSAHSPTLDRISQQAANLGR